MVILDLNEFIGNTTGGLSLRVLHSCFLNQTMNCSFSVNLTPTFANFISDFNITFDKYTIKCISAKLLQP